MYNLYYICRIKHRKNRRVILIEGNIQVGWNWLFHLEGKENTMSWYGNHYPQLSVNFTHMKVTFVRGKNYPEIGVNITLGFFCEYTSFKIKNACDYINIVNTQVRVFSVYPPLSHMHDPAIIFEWKVNRTQSNVFPSSFVFSVSRWCKRYIPQSKTRFILTYDPFWAYY